MPTIRTAALSGALIMLTACGGGGNSFGQYDTGSISATLASHGRAQKGPYQTGSPVTLYELDSSGDKTGRTVTTQVNGVGWFIFDTPWTGPTELEVTGHFFDESNGTLSVQPCRLTAWVDLPATDITHINLFTHLVAARMQMLMASGENFETAQATAYSELRTLVDLVAVDSRELAQLDLTDGQSENAIDNANLLLFSTALLTADIDQTGIDTLYSDFADDGLLNGAALPQWIRTSVYAGTVDLDQVKTTLETLDGVVRAPGFDELNSTYPSWVALEGDRDNDGLSDPQEVLVYGSDPLLVDTDGDGLADGWEATHLLNLLVNDADDDPDADGLSNLDEYNYTTNPRTADTDGDTYIDSYEIGSGGDPNDASSLPLAFTSSPVATGESGFSYTYPVQITWGSASFSLDNAPSGMSIDIDTGIVSWIPTLAQTGDFSVAVRATTGPYSVTQSFSITMTPGNTGDINEDGVVDAKDIILGERAMLGLMVPSATQLVRGDVVADGTIKGSDVVAIQRLAFGL